MKIAKIFLEFAKRAGIDVGGAVVDERELGFFLLQLGLEDLPRAGNGIALVVEEAFDAQSHFNIAAAIETLPGAPFVGFELRKLAFPEPQDIGWNIAELGDFTDAEVKLVRDVGPGCWGSFADWLMLCHARTPIPLRRRRWPTLRHVCKYRPPNRRGLQFFLRVKRAAAGVGSVTWSVRGLVGK